MSNNNLSIQGIHIQTMYSDFRSKRFLINRKYQRKLAWTIEEKRNFIDTLIRGLPIPLFLLAEVDYEGKKVLEVIDGMQRLDAIFSFIEQRFGLKNGYFDLGTTADTLALRSEMEIIQKFPILEKEVSKKIVNYLLPVSKSVFNDENEIEDAFRRINSNGRHLSPQEIRQAGASGKFPDIVRIISSQIRGDFSNDSLLLNEMSKISISNYRLDYYGLNVDDIFWVKNKLLSNESIRASKDEEVIGHIISNIVLEEKANYTQKNLDAFYGFSPNPLAPTPKEKSKIETSIDRVSPEALIRQFNYVFGTIEDLFEKNRKHIRNWIYRNARSEENPRAFHVLFMAFYELLVKKNQVISNEEGLLAALKNIGDDLIRFQFTQDLYEWKTMDKTIDSIVGRIQNNFNENLVEDPAYYDWTKEFSNILMQSNTEQNLFEFKIGLFDLQTKKYNKDIVNKILKTLTAINNLGINKIGYVIIGVANSKEAAEKHQETYGGVPFQKNNFYITGIDLEAIENSKNIDNYLHLIKEQIKLSPVEPKEYILEILKNFKSRQFFGKEVIILKTQYENPVWFEGELYERQGSHNEIVSKENIALIYKRFFK